MPNHIATDYEQFEQASPRSRRLLRQEELILEVTEMICDAMERNDVNKAALAGELGKSRGFVSQILNGTRNLTLRTLSDLADALGYVIQFRMVRDGRAAAVLHANVGGAKAHWKVTVDEDRVQQPPPSAPEWATEMKTEAVIRDGDTAGTTKDSEEAKDLCLV